MAEDDRETRRSIDAAVVQLPVIKKSIEAVEARSKADLIPSRPLRRRARSAETAGTRESEFARLLIAERRLRDGLLGADLFGEPAWDMLLDLFVAHEERESVSVSSLCVAAAVPATTALRWINTLVQNDMAIRRHDPTDGRRIWIELAPHVVAEMRRLLTTWMTEQG